MTHFSPLPPLNTTFTEGPQPRIASQPPADIGGIVTSKRSKSIPEKASFTASCSQADSGDPAPQVAPIGALGNSARHQTRAASAPSSRHRALGRGVRPRRPPRSGLRPLAGRVSEERSRRPIERRRSRPISLRPPRRSVTRRARRRVSLAQNHPFAPC